MKNEPRAALIICGARCRDGHACRCYAMKGRRRCRLHGGLSTGPKTEAGRAAIAHSNRARRLRREYSARENP